MTEELNTKDILILTCVFSPEPVVSSRMALDLAKELSKKGNIVRVVCPFPSKTGGKLYKGYKRRFWSIDNTFKNFEVIRCFSFFSPKSKLVNRFLENFSFGFSSSIYLTFMRKKPDVIYLNTWPLFATIMNIFVAKVFKIRIVRSIKDVYPESLISQNRLSKNSSFYKILEKIEDYCFKNSQENIVLSEKIGELIKSKNPEFNNFVTIADWNNITNQKDNLRKSSLDISLNEDDKLFIFAGNISAAANVEGIIQAFSNVAKNFPHVKLVIAGEGSMLPSCVDLVRILKQEKNISFFNPWKPEDTISLLKCADILLLPTDRKQAFYSMPSKVISYMFSERPILAFGAKGSELENIIKSAKCGWFEEAFDEVEMEAAISKVIKLDNAKIAGLGSNGKSYMLNNLSKDANLKKYVNLITA